MNPNLPDIIAKMIPCSHPAVTCLNGYELVRKYRCEVCRAVMMCACDEKVARKFLAHQLHHATELDTRTDVPVTLGFQPTICRECRGLQPEAFPKSPQPGRTSKIRRYYWRELWFETMERFAAWADAEGSQVASRRYH